MAMCFNKDITTWLDRLGLVNYAEKFLVAGYFSLQQCLTLSKADFLAIGVTKPGHVCRLIRDLQKLNANGEPENSCSQPKLLSLPLSKTAKESSPIFSKGEAKVAPSNYDEILPPPLPPRPQKVQLKLVEYGNYDDCDDISPPPLPKRTIVVPPPPPPLNSSYTDDEGSDIDNEGISIVTESPCMHNDDNVDVAFASKLATQQTRRNDAIKTCISSEKEHEIVEKSVDIKYSFLIDKLRSEIQKNTLSSCVQSMELIADPHCTAIINIKGTEVSVKQAKSEISSFIKDNVTTYSYEPDNFFARPILRSPEMLQLSKKIQNELSVSLTIKLQPKVLSSALDESGVIVQVCEGDITLENSDIFINFTDENLTLSDDLLDMLDEAGMKKYERYLQNDTPQSSGTAIYFGRAKDKTVVHAVLPEWIDGKSGEGHLITYALVNALNMAAYFRAVSISLPFLSCIDENIPPDVFVESCLSGVQQFLKSTDLVQVIRLVLPVTMTKKFEEKFNHGVFEQFVMTDELNIAGTNRFFNLERPEDSAWLWEDDDGIYNYYQPEHNRLLNKAVKFVSSCSLKIGPIKYRVDYRDMTQVNTRTSKKRKVVRLPLGFIWQFKEPKGKWEQFSPQVTLMIEAMYSTNTNHSLIINDCLYAFDFTYMTQWNMDTKQKASIRRIDRKKSACNPTRSTVTISGLTEDIHKADIMVKQRIESLKTVQFIDVLRRLIPTFETCKEHIQDKYNVIIARESNVTMLPVVKYKIEGYNECIQKASIEIYKSMATTQKPIEWEPQSKPIILIDILKRSPEWSKVCARMRMTLKCNVLSIKRIQNEFLWEKYVQHKELMAHKGSQSTTEMELFHGTSNNHPKCIYESEEGFDMRYSREGLWGQGNYFAENADYASSFAFTAGRRYKCNNESIDIFQLFLVKVLVGHSCKIHQDNTLRMPPFKPDRKFRYDTVTGFLYGSNIYITYSNDKAYPFYLISYTLKA